MGEEKGKKEGKVYEGERGKERLHLGVSGAKS